MQEEKDLNKDNIQDIQNEQITQMLKEYGLTTVQGVLRVSRVWGQYKDVLRDTTRFLHDYDRYQQLSDFFNKQKNMMENIEKALDTQIEQAKFQEWWDSLSFNPFSNNLGANLTSTELEQQRSELMKEFNQLSKIYSSDINMQEYADGLMEQYRFTQCFQLLATYGQMVNGYFQISKKNEDLSWIKKKLEDIDQIYIQPVIEELKKFGTYNIEKIENGLDKIENLSEYINKGINDINNQTYTHGINAVINAIDVIASMDKIRQLWNYASPIQLAVQGSLAVFQASASVGSLYLTVWSAYTWRHWKDLAEELNKRQMTLKEYNKDFQKLKEKAKNKDTT